MLLDPMIFFKAFFSPFVVGMFLFALAVLIVKEILKKKLNAWMKQRKQKVALAKGAAAGLCPLCNSPLVLRTARKGANAGSDFYGCSNFPKCRYTKKID